MYLILTASSDAYIQNKIIGSTYRSTDANTGRSGTLDLYKLYGETKLPPTETAVSPFALDNDSDGAVETSIELSRLFVKFDYAKLISQASENMDVREASFKAYLSLKTVSAGQFTPKDFTVDVLPLAQAFDEGVGKDVISYRDLDSCNFITASISGDTVNLWNSPGAGALGALGAANLDAYNTANLGDGVVNIKASQTFNTGEENLWVDVTHLVSASLTGQITNHGFRVAFKPSEETDSTTRFVKRFASRHAKNPYLRPGLHVIWDDSIRDNSNNAVFDHSNTLYFQNYLRGLEQDLKIGATTYNGADCLRLVISSGSFSLTSNVSSVTSNTTDTNRPGLYKASFTINSDNDSIVRQGQGYLDKISDFAIKSGSLKFTTEWKTPGAGSITVHTGSITLNQTDRYQGNFTSRKPHVSTVNLNSEYKHSDVARIRLFGRDINAEYNEKYGSVPQKRKPVGYDLVAYSVIDALTEDAAIPENKTHNGTRVSTDYYGMFFDLDMSILHPGRSYYLSFSVVERGTTTVIRDKNLTFKVIR